MSTKTTITLEEATWKALAMIKLNLGLSTMDAAVQYLLKSQEAKALKSMEAVKKA